MDSKDIKNCTCGPTRKLSAWCVSEPFTHHRQAAPPGVSLDVTVRMLTRTCESCGAFYVGYAVSIPGIPDAFTIEQAKQTGDRYISLLDMPHTDC